jgi:exopolyphosphatase/guanosine-5'-triphosphate,3'-diphosphate pyrophosphatase
VADRFASKEFHAVGGAWRNLALLHMQLADYPLRVAHQYEMSRADALEVARFVERQSKSSLERIEGLTKKRFDTLPYSALVLEALIEKLGVERVVISAYGVREGLLLLEAMEPDVRRQDPLIAGCEALTARAGLSTDLGGALEAWLTPAFERLPRCSATASRCCWPPPAGWPTSARACTPTTAPTWSSNRCCARRSPA